VRLFGFSAASAVDFQTPIAEMLAAAGGRHGWGLSVHDGCGSRRFTDPTPDRDGSALAGFMRTYSVRGRTVLGYASEGGGTDREQPYTRELWGRSWSFVHVGRLRSVKRWALDRHRPIGTSGGEHAFCWLLDRLHDRWAEAPRDTAVAAFLRVLTSRLWVQGRFDMMLTDGRSLFCFAGGTSPLAIQHGVTAGGTTVAAIASRPTESYADRTTMRSGTFVALRHGVEVPVHHEARSQAWSYGWMERTAAGHVNGIAASRRHA
jgi:glutamine amidotransferase